MGSGARYCQTDLLWLFESVPSIETIVKLIKLFELVKSTLRCRGLLNLCNLLH